MIRSDQISRSVMSYSLRPHESQHARPPCPPPTPGVHSNSRPSSQWCHPAISSSVIPSPPAPNPSQHQGLFQWVNSSHEVAKVLELQLQHQSFQWTPRMPYDSVIPPQGREVNTYIHTETCTQMFIVVLFVMPKKWKQPKYPSTYPWINKM